MNMLEELKGLGVNVDEALKRLGGNEAFYKKMLGRIQSMLEETTVNPEFDANDYQEVIENAHAIKGAISPLRHCTRRIPILWICCARAVLRRRGRYLWISFRCRPRLSRSSISTNKKFSDCPHIFSYFAI